MSKKEFVKGERNFMYEFLIGLNDSQWSARSLCKGWNVEDVAAHIVCRERNLIGGIGLVVPGLHGLHDARLKRVKAKGRDYILHKIKKYPWWMAAALNTSEFYVHNEDMLRGELKMSRKEPNAEAQEILWGSLKGLVRVKKDMVEDLDNVALLKTQTKEKIQIPGSSPRMTEGVIVTGLASECLLYFYGRREAAKVSIKKAS